METITELIALAKAHAWTTLLLHGALAIILLAFARRSQIDAWAESRPKLAGALKILRGLGIDPWLILQGVSLLIKGKLPPKDPPSSGVPKGSDVLRGLPTAGLCLFALFAFACSPADRQKLRSAAEEIGARDPAMAACAIAHSYDGQIPEAESVLRWCSKAQFAQPWVEIAQQAKALVDAQRAGKIRPDPEPKPEPVPAPPPVPPSEPVLAPKPNEA